jgi:hypothetical protein
MGAVLLFLCLPVVLVFLAGCPPLWIMLLFLILWYQGRKTSEHRP